jgi:hypothetical protein
MTITLRQVDIKKEILSDPVIKEERWSMYRSEG